MPDNRGNLREPEVDKRHDRQQDKQHEEQRNGRQEFHGHLRWGQHLVDHEISVIQRLVERKGLSHTEG